MFQDHSFKKALENGGVAFPECVSPKAIPKFADEIYILNFVFESCDILSKALRCYIGDRRAYHMARARIFNKTRACVFLETEVDSNHSNRVRMKCTMSNMHMISLSLSLNIRSHSWELMDAYERNIFINLGISTLVSFGTCVYRIVGDRRILSLEVFEF